MASVYLSTIQISEEEKEHLNQLYVRYRYLEMRYKESFLFMSGLIAVAAFSYAIVLVTKGYPDYWHPFLFFFGGLFCASLAYSQHFYFKQSKAWKCFYKTLRGSIDKAISHDG